MHNPMTTHTIAPILVFIAKSDLRFRRQLTPRLQSRPIYEK